MAGLFVPSPSLTRSPGDGFISRAVRRLLCPINVEFFFMPFASFFIFFFGSAERLAGREWSTMEVGQRTFGNFKYLRRRRSLTLIAWRRYSSDTEASDIRHAAASPPSGGAAVISSLRVRLFRACLWNTSHFGGCRGTFSLHFYAGRLGRFSSYQPP